MSIIFAGVCWLLFAFSVTWRLHRVEEDVKDIKFALDNIALEEEANEPIT